MLWNLWINAPRWLYVPIYIALGWAAVFYFTTFWKVGGLAVFVLIPTGAVLYHFGGIIYALKKPYCSINWFGFHQLFHAMTAAAFLIHFAAAVIVIVY